MLIEEDIEQALFEEWTEADRGHCLFRLAVGVFFLFIDLITALSVEAPGRYLAAFASATMLGLIAKDALVIRHKQFNEAPRYKREVLEGFLLPAQATLFVIIVMTGAPYAPLAYLALAAVCVLTMFVVNAW